MSWSRPITTACQWCSATWNGGLTLTPRSMMSIRSDPSVSSCARLIRRSTRSRKRTSTRSSAPPDPPEMRSIFGLHRGKATKIYIPPSPEAFLHGQDPSRTWLAVRTVYSGHCGMVVARQRATLNRPAGSARMRLGPEPVGPAHRHRSLRAGSPGFVDVVGRRHDQGCDFRRVCECDEGLTAHKARRLTLCIAIAIQQLSRLVNLVNLGPVMRENTDHAQLLKACKETIAFVR